MGSVAGRRGGAWYPIPRGSKWGADGIEDGERGKKTVGWMPPCEPGVDPI